MKNSIYIFLIGILFSSFTLLAQSDYEIYENDEYIENPDTVTQAIILYDKFNPKLGGDSIRLVNGKPASGLIKDYYPNKQLKHKGFYAQGQLKSSYINYYPNGKIERKFKAKGTYGGVLELFYNNGENRYFIQYNKGAIIEYKEYYPNGQLANHEKYFKNGEILEFNYLYYPNGQQKLSMELVDKKNKIYQMKISWPDGKIKQEGKKYYNKAIMTYLKNGPWKVYQKNGSLLRIEEYNFGDLVN